MRMKVQTQLEGNGWPHARSLSSEDSTYGGKCLTCAYYFELPSNPYIRGECRVNGPTPGPRRWPVVSGTDTCGEYHPWDKELDGEA